MRRVLVVLVLCTLLSAPAAQPTHAAPVLSATTTITAHGVRLTVTLPGRTFPSDALVHVTAIARNISHHRLWVLGGGPPSSGKSLPQIQVLSGTEVVYPPALPWYFPYPGPGPSAIPLAPGKTLRSSTYVVLRAPSVIATLTLMRTRTSFGETTDITTRPLAMMLTAPTPPKVTEVTTPGGPQVEIAPPPGATGKLVYQTAAECAGETGAAQTVVWTRSEGTTFTPGCVPMQQWHLIAGWPGYTAATVDLSARH